MKKILAITLITLGVLIAGGYTTSVYAEPTQAYKTTDTLPAQPTSIAWGKGVNTLYHAECAGPWVATMTHTFNYVYPCILVDIDDDHLEWESLTNPGDYMIKWTNIWASTAATGTFYLKITVSECLDLIGPNGSTMTTYYAIKESGGSEPVRSDFIRAPAFNGPLPGTSVSGTDQRIYYDKDLWARLTPEFDENGNSKSNPPGKYEDVFYLTFAFSRTP